MQPTSSFDEAFRDLYRPAYRAAYGVSGSRFIAEEAANEALFRASIRWAKVADRALPWVVRVASNLAVDHLRTERRWRRTHRDDTGTSPDSAADAVERMDLHAAIRGLPKRQREVLVLRYFGGLTEAAIAGFLGIAPGTVKAHASRGIETLRSALGPMTESPVNERTMP